MAVMIPPLISEDCQSPAEISMFERFKASDDTANWTVLHSLDIAQHTKQLVGEIDFVVIVPEKGILCIEVKGCQSLTRKDGRWFYGPNDLKGDLRGPFKQASTGMHSLRSFVGNKNWGLSSVLLYSCVDFPYIYFDDESPEWHPWQVIDKKQWDREDISYTVNKILDNARSHVASKPQGFWFKPALKEPTVTQSKQLVDKLRGDFEYFKPRKATAGEQEAEILKFTEEQFECLDNMKLNPRVVFTGPAGTGKTLLAIESLRRAHANGERAMLVCFNRLLGSWLQEQVADLGDGIKAGHISQIMAEIVGAGAIPDSPSDAFWDTDLPSLAIGALIDEKDKLGFGMLDRLVIDEGQDILKSAYLDLLDLLLKGGLRAGQWTMFGDFNNQDIFGSGGMGLTTFMEERSGNASLFQLGVNCRNAPRVADQVNILTGVNYSQIRRSDNDMQSQLIVYTDNDDQEKKLVKYLEDCSVKDKLRPEDIIVLSPRSDCAADRMSAKPWNQRLVPLTRSKQGEYPYHTIQGFKGLERPVVILTDFSDVEDPEFKALLYVGMTRATEKVAVFASEGARKQLEGQLFEG